MKILRHISLSMILILNVINIGIAQDFVPDKLHLRSPENTIDSTGAAAQYETEVATQLPATAVADSVNVFSNSGQIVDPSIGVDSSSAVVIGFSRASLNLSSAINGLVTVHSKETFNVTQGFNVEEATHLKLNSQKLDWISNSQVRSSYQILDVFKNSDPDAGTDIYLRVISNGSKGYIRILCNSELSVVIITINNDVQELQLIQCPEL